MKKKIVFGLGIFALMFLFGGVYIVMTTAGTVYDLHRLSQLHHPITLRQDLLISIKKNQSNIKLRNTRFALEPESTNGNTPVGIVRKCLHCHNSAAEREKIEHLRSNIEMYQALTLGVFTSRPQSALSEHRAAAALELGDKLIRNVEHMIAITSDSLERQERQIIRNVNRKQNLLFALVTIGPFFAVGLAFILIRGLTRPVNSLLDATRRLKAGDLEHRIEGLKDEFGEVADSFNEMAASLKKQMQEMQRTEQLRVCGEMAAGLAHEIRNPLAGMKVSIEVLLAELDIEARDRDVLVKIIEQIRHIELLMKNLLNYARPVSAQPVSLDVNKVLEKTVFFVERHPSFTADEPKRQMVRQFDDTLPVIVGDPQQLQQVFLNLLLNAVDATAEGGEITVMTRFDRQAKGVVVEVQDTGKGIPAESMGKLFQPFFTTKGKGTGLGLAVSKRIIEEHGGTIEATNHDAGGVSFTVTLPVEPNLRGTTA